jgi:AraC-like DNA-binding protein
MNSFQFTGAIADLYKLAMDNRRNSHPRYQVNQPVSLLIGNNGCRVFCDLKDMSLTGAGLTSVPLRYMPQTFKILITSENVALPCKLRWIEGTEVGVQFIGDPEQVLKEHEPQQSSMVTDVRQTVANLLPSGRAKADAVATELGLTRPTMHRRLTEQGAGFTELHDTLCRDLAERYIAEENLNFQQVAFLLGYADQSAFSVAFKRSTGLSPEDARAQTA